MAEKKPFCNYSGRTKELQAGDTLPGGTVYASAAEELAGAEAAKAIAPLTNLQLIRNLKLAVNASVNKLDVFTKSGEAVPDATNIISVAIPDGTGYTFRSRAAAYLSGTSQFILADATNYWSKGSLDAEIKAAYIYAIWDGTGIIWALGGYSGFTRVPASTTATDDDFFLLEASSTYTKAVTEYCVCVGKIRYQYDTADNPDHTIQATVLDAPQVMWNPKSDYGYQKDLAADNTSASDIALYSAVSLVVKQSGRYLILCTVSVYLAIITGYYDATIRTGSSTFSSALTLTISQVGIPSSFGTGGQAQVAQSGSRYLNAGDTIHLGTSCIATTGSGNRRINSPATSLSFMRID